MYYSVLFTINDTVYNFKKIHPLINRNFNYRNDLGPPYSEKSSLDCMYI